MSKIVFCNNEIKDIKYSGFTITKVYACDGEVVYEKKTPVQYGNITYTASTLVSLRDCFFDPEVTANTFSNGVGVVEFGSPVRQIGDYAFSASSGMTAISLPGSLIKLYDGVFYNNPDLQNIHFEPGDSLVIGNNVFNSCPSLTSMVIPDNVTNIGSGAFQNNTSLSSCTIGSGVTTITSYFFHNCTSLASFVIPLYTTTIGEAAFKNCTSLTSIEIPSEVTYIGASAFTDCSGLTGITCNAIRPPELGADVFNNTNNCPIYVPCESINVYKASSGWSVYEGRIQCVGPTPAVTGITYTSSEKLNVLPNRFYPTATGETFSAGTGVVEFDNPVREIGNYAFQYKYSMAYVVIPDSVTKLGEGAFDNAGLSGCTIGSGVTSIGVQAFSHNGKLLSIIIPSSVRSIGVSAFHSCYSLTSITCLATTPPKLGYSDVFSNTNNCPIYVPAGSVETYKSASYWSNYASRIQSIT